VVSELVSEIERSGHAIKVTSACDNSVLEHVIDRLNTA
jgi:hypothetical protein